MYIFQENPHIKLEFWHNSLQSTFQSFFLFQVNFDNKIRKTSKILVLVLDIREESNYVGLSVRSVRAGKYKL